MTPSKMNIKKITQKAIMIKLRGKKALKRTLKKNHMKERHMHRGKKKMRMFTDILTETK